ncbi:MAG: hypothetical protein U0744_15570 [Gemmataceae bacterium]
MGFSGCDRTHRGRSQGWRRGGPLSSAAGHFVARGLYNSNSKLRVRLYSWAPTPTTRRCLLPLAPRSCDSASPRGAACWRGRAGEPTRLQRIGRHIGHGRRSVRPLARRAIHQPSVSGTAWSICRDASRVDGG